MSSKFFNRLLGYAIPLGSLICGVVVLLAPTVIRRIAWIMLGTAVISMFFATVAQPPQGGANLGRFWDSAAKIAMTVYIVALAYRHQPDPSLAPLCPTCGYSLRGLSGERPRCPECGSTSKID